MGFLSPLFLVGLAAVAVPVIIHLIHRERRVVVEFPSLMFLQRIPYRSVRRQKLRHLLLLLLRCAALAMLAAAFARPFFTRKAPAVATHGAREVVILLDQSASMGYGGRWSAARNAAGKAIASLAPGDHGEIVLFAGDAAVASAPMATPEQLRAAVAAAHLTAQPTHYAPALKLAAQLLAASALPRRELVVISDFQKSGWTNHGELSLPLGTTVVPVDVGAGAAPDVAVASVTTDRDSTGDRDHVVVAARLTNTGSAPRRVTAGLDVAGRDVQSQMVTVPASGAVQVAFAPVAVPFGVTRGLVHVTPDSLPEDDVFAFTLAPDEAVPVLLVEPASPRPNQSLYISRALSIGDRPAFRVDETPITALTPRDLDGRSLVILDEVAPPAGSVGARLRSLVAGGAGLVVVPGALPAATWPAEWRAVLPASVGTTIDRTGDAGGSLSSVDYSHPIFELFSAPGSGDFSTARFYRYRALTPAAGGTVIARFDDGAPALVEGALGDGKIIEWASTLDAYWTNLPLQPVYLPFVHQLGAHVGRYADPRASYAAGTVLDLSRHGELTEAFTKNGGASADSTTQLVMQTPSGKRIPVTASGAEHLVPLTEQGFYELRGPATPVGAGRPIAVNLDPSETDLSHFDPQELVTAVSTPSAPPSGGAAGVAPRDEERQQKLWWYLMLFAVALLAFETAVSNRLSRAST